VRERIGPDLIEYYEDEPAVGYCRHCGCELEWIKCDQCDGEGIDGHDCGEDVCCCLDPEPNDPCAQCGGLGGWFWCDNRGCPGKKEATT